MKNPETLLEEGGVWDRRFKVACMLFCFVFFEEAALWVAFSNAPETRSHGLIHAIHCATAAGDFGK
jgi:hypothetical protein